MKESQVNIASPLAHHPDIVGRKRDKNELSGPYRCTLLFIFCDIYRTRQKKYQVIGFYILLMVIETDPSEKPSYFLAL